ncbi:MAG TPA: hypothetical protein VHD87_01985 [Acidimicrobiales bacterium]|nr:hypothetical protein [Acidimicrobiales bacterium]
MEPPRATGAARRPPAPPLTARATHARRSSRRNPRPAPRTVPIPIANGALAAGAVLALTERGDLWTLAVAFGVADGSVVTGIAVLGAAAATLARTGTAGLAGVAGAQAVLGAAGFTGSALAVGATWASAVSLVLVARQRAAGAVLGLTAGLLVAGPSLAGGAKSVGTWVLGALVGTAVGLVAAPGEGRRRWQRYVALVLGAAGLAVGIAAGYH